MKNPRDLHRIIKSLTKSEKRLFKMYVSNGQKTNNNYTLLFDAIDAQEIYDERRLLRKLKTHTFSKQISRTKYLLYEQILKVLRQLYSSRSEHAKLGSLLGSVEVLYHKTLYLQAYEVLKRANKIAIANQLYGLQQEILDWEIKLLPYLENYKTIKPAIDQLLDSYEIVAQKLKTENEYKALHTQVRLYYDTLLNFHESTQVNTHFGRVIQHPMMKDEVYADTFLSKMLFHEIHFLNANAQSNYAAALSWGSKIFEIWQANPKLKNVYRDTFIRQLRDFTFCKISHQNALEEVLHLMEEWKSINAFSKEEEAKFTFEIDSIHFLLQLANNSYSGIEAIYHRIKEHHMANLDKVQIHQRVVIFYHIAVYHFFGKRYGETWRWIKKVDELAGGKIHPHMIKYVRLMELMVRFELDDPGVEDKDLQRIHRHLKSLGALGKIEEMLLTSIKKLMYLPLLDDLPVELKNLNSMLELEEKFEGTPKTISNQIIKVWVKDKLTTERRF